MDRNRRRRALGAILLLAVASCGGGGGGGTTVIVVAGALDPSFSGDGLSIGFLSGGLDAATDVAVQGDGKIVVVGTMDLVFAPDFFAARFLPDGTPDDTFGFAGLRIVDVGGIDRCNAVAIQPNGKIVLAGSSDGGGGNDFAIVRLNADGTDDTTFDGDGFVYVDPSSGGDDQANDVLVQPNGAIVVVGGESIGVLANFGVLRLDSLGAPDVSFAGTGYLPHTFGGEDVAMAVKRDPADGSLVVAGRSDIASVNDFAVCRFSASGVFDVGFGNRIVDFSVDDQASDVQIQADRKILVSGTVDGGLPDFAVARLDVGGTLDTTYNDIPSPSVFNGDGRLLITFGTPPFGGDEGSVRSLLLADGRLILVGKTDAGGGTPDNTAVARVTGAGALDTTFSGDGRETYDLLGASFEVAFAAAQTPDGGIVVVGIAAGGVSLFKLGN